MTVAKKLRPNEDKKVSSYVDGLPWTYQLYMNEIVTPANLGYTFKI